MSDLSREDRAWLAGLIDGEGCLDSPRGNPRIRIRMGDLDVILRAADAMGNPNVYTEVDSRRTVLGTPRTPMHCAQITGDRAVAVMRAVLPWLGSRRSAKVVEIITAHEARKHGKIRLLKAA